MRVNAWLYSPTLITDPGTPANPRYEKGLMHITDMVPTLVRLRCSTDYRSLAASFGLAGVSIIIVVMSDLQAGGLGGVTPKGGRPLDGVNVFDMLSNASVPSPRTEILHLIDPLGNGKTNFTMVCFSPDFSV